MTYEEARKYLWREPFQPVRIRLKDGRRYEVLYPRWTLAAEAILMVGVPPEDNPGSRFPDHMVWVRWPEVDAIEPLSEPATPTVGLQCRLDSEHGKPENSLGSSWGGESIMTCEQARQYLWRKPFQPVRIRLKDGRSFDIRHKGMTLAAEAMLIIGIPPADEPDARYSDRTVWARWPEVEAIEPLSEPATPVV
jgi:hypothetical protein